MTDDLVKRLQDYLDCRPWAAGRTFDATHPECLIVQAKDRIEALETALQKYSCDCNLDDQDNCEVGCWDSASCGYAARAALGEKKDG
jgi:hypothetical protein